MRYSTLFLLFVSLTLLLSTGCSPKSSNANYITAENVVKNLTVDYTNRMESTPVVWKDELYDVVSNRMDSSDHKVEIYYQGRCIGCQVKLRI